MRKTANKRQIDIMPNNYLTYFLRLVRDAIGHRIRYLTLLILGGFFFAPQAHAQRMWINEFHYENVGADVGEFIEVVVELGADLNNIFVQTYNGVNGNPYGSPVLVSSFTGTADTVGCFGIYSHFIAGIQNGPPDGIALAHQGVAVEFISYEGDFVGASGVAAGYQSVDVGVSESDGTGIGFSLQRTGTGVKRDDFTWTGPSIDSPGTINNSQDFSDPSLSMTLVDAPDPSEPVAPGDKIKYTVTITNSGDGDAKNANLDRLMPVDPNTTVVGASFMSTPIALDASYNTAVEDAATFEVVLGGFDPDGDQLTYSITSPTTNGSLTSVSPAGPTAGSATVFYIPNPDFFGMDQLTFQVEDNDGNQCTAVVMIDVQPVNDPPTITCGPDQAVVNIAGAQSIAAWATGISVGPANESFQTATITTASDVPSLFSVQPSVDAAGTLTYTPAVGVQGIANVTVTISDGVFADDQSCSFVITVQSIPDAVNDALSTNATVDLNADLFANNGIAVDDLGFPAATITHFGGIDLGASVFDNTDGSTVALAGGTLKVNANGTLSLTGQPFTPGSYSFQYRLANAAGNDIATVTIEINDAPVAQDDAFTMLIGFSTVSGNVTADNGSGADNLGTPAATVTSFGGGSLLGSVTDNSAGVAILGSLIGGGDLTIMADGTITLTGATTPGEYTVDYRLTNTGGTSDGTVTITVQQLPDAVNDDLVISEDMNLSANLFDNNGIAVDNLGFPVGAVASYGGGPDLDGGTGAVTDHSAGTTINGSAIGGGDLFVDTDGTITLTGQPFTPGTYSFFYRLSNVPGFDDAEVTITINPAGDPPVAADDAFSLAQCSGNLVGNVFSDNGSGADDLGTPSATVSHFGITLVTENSAGGSTAFAGGTLSIAANGALILTNPTEFGVFTAKYLLDNGIGTSEGTVTITISQTVYIVDNTAAGGGNGSLSTPFNTLGAAAAAANNSGDIIYVRTGSGNYTGGITLNNGQLLLGEGVALECPASNTLIAAGTRPTITNAGGDAVSLANGNTVRGLNISSTSGDGMAGSSIAGLVIDQVMITSAGVEGISLDNASGAIDFDNVEVASTTTKSVRITNSTGSMTFTADNSTFRDTQSSGTGEDGIEIGLSGTATATIDIDNCSFLRNRTNGLQVLVEGNSIVSQCDITNSTFDAGTTGAMIGLDLSANGSGSLTYNVVGNTKIHSRNGNAINTAAFSNSIVRGRINNNSDIRVLGPTATVPASSGSGIRIASENDSDVVMQIDGNTITGIEFDNGISVVASGGSTTAHATINNNTINFNLAGSFPLYGIETRAQNSRTLCANVTNNAITIGGAIAAFRARVSDATASLQLQGFSVDAATTWSANGNTPAASVSQSVVAGGTLGAGTCTTVTHPLP